MEQSRKMILSLPMQDGEEQNIFGVDGYMLTAISDKGVNLVLAGQISQDAMAKMLFCMFFAGENKYRADMRRALWQALWCRITRRYAVGGTETLKDE